MVALHRRDIQRKRLPWVPGRSGARLREQAGEEGRRRVQAVSSMAHRAGSHQERLQQAQLHKTSPLCPPPPAPRALPSLPRALLGSPDAGMADKVLQDRPRPGGFPEVPFKRNIPVRGPSGAALFLGSVAITVFGFGRIIAGNQRRR